jgi:hypothetical protein
MSVADVIARMREIDEELPPGDGVAVFNRMYLTVTERIATALTGHEVFHDPEFMHQLDVSFADHFLDAYDLVASGRDAPKAWAPLFESREADGVLPIQFALAGLNTHIEHDLPLAVVRTCEDMGLSPRHRGVRDDYEEVNDLLADVEQEVRRSFLDEVQQRIDDHIGPVVHLVSAWNIDKARDVAWVSVETLWTLRSTTVLSMAFREGLAHTVGMGSRILLTPCGALRLAG